MGHGRFEQADLVESIADARLALFECPVFLAQWFRSVSDPVRNRLVTLRAGSGMSRFIVPSLERYDTPERRTRKPWTSYRPTGLENFEFTRHRPQESTARAENGRFADQSRRPVKPCGIETHALAASIRMLYDNGLSRLLKDGLGADECPWTDRCVRNPT